jgi:hypothetical protein
MAWLQNKKVDKNDGKTNFTISMKNCANINYLFIYCGGVGKKLQVLMAPIRGFPL